MKEFILFLENSAVVDGIGLRKIAKELLPAVTTKVAWGPGHKDVYRNEVADTRKGRIRASSILNQGHYKSPYKRIQI